MGAETHKILTVSTEHVRPEEADKLDSIERIGTLRGRYGWLTWLPERGQLLEKPSPGLRAVVRLARQLKCRYVMFDRDGPTMAGIPTYDW